MGKQLPRWKTVLCQLQHREEGGIFALTAAIVAGVIFLALLGLSVGQVVVQRQRLDALADATALGAAKNHVWNIAPACIQAELFVHQEKPTATVERCVTEDDPMRLSVTILLSEPIQGPLVRFAAAVGAPIPEVFASARAGPQPP